MSVQRQDQRLLGLLQQQHVLASKGFTCEPGESRGLILLRGSHFRGIWCFDGIAYRWTPAGYNEPTQFCSDAAAAVEYTINVLAAA